MRVRLQRNAPSRPNRSAKRSARSGVTTTVVRVTLAAVVGVIAVVVASTVRGDAPRPLTVAAASAPTTKATTTTQAPAAPPSKAFCDLLRGYVDEVRSISISLTDPAALPSLLNDALAAITQSAAMSTGATAADVTTMGSVLGDLKGGFEATGYDLSRLPPDTVLSLSSPKFMATFARLQALLAEGC